MHRFYMTGYCRNERNAGISDIEKIINTYGFIVDFKMFSDISLSMIIEMEESKVDSLFVELKKYMKMNDFENPNAESGKECTVLLHVTFLKGRGDLKIEPPAVPG